MTPDPVARRDAGLRRVSHLTRGAVAGSLVLTGALSALAARSFAGTTGTTTAGAPVAGTTTATVAPTTPATTSASATPATTATTAPRSTLRTPATVPQPSSGSGRVTSGGS